ncbi:MAG: ATP-dependent DNA helicase [Thermoplasmatales archaeon]|nr:ATP-dependent DNA helicase [Thermoplasmatales archaeon]
MAEPSVFPYAHRPYQAEIVRGITESLSAGRHFVVESGTGTGKTVAALSGALDAALPRNSKVIYLTRTKSQQRQVMLELRRISRKRPVLGITVQGRNPLTCPRISDDPELSGGTPEELSRLCSEFKKEGKGGPCPHYLRAMEDAAEIASRVRDETPTPEEFIDRCTRRGACPYEAAKALIPMADVIAAPYSFLLSPLVSGHFVRWAESPLGEMFVVADEAHNLPDYLRDVMTSRYTTRALDLAAKEAAEWGDPSVHDGVPASALVGAFGKCLSEAAGEFVADGEDDALLPPYHLEDEMMYALGCTSVTLRNMYRNLAAVGESIRERKKEMRKLPRSYLGSLGDFLMFWTGCDDETYVKLVEGGENPAFEAYCMDPAPAAAPFRECAGSVHMSGTLGKPEDHALELGLSGSDCRVYPSPFDPANLLSLHTTDATTKYDEFPTPENVAAIMGHVVGLTKAADRNTAVFFPSYRVMDFFLSQGLAEAVGRKVYMERRGMGQAELMETIDSFSGSDGAVLFAVSGGRVSEGVDFPDKALELAIIVGIPYPYMSAKVRALERYFDIKFGDGWERVAAKPAARKMRQSRGRLIRSEGDRGACVVLDRRTPALEGYDSRGSEDPEAEVAAFFSM